MILLTDEIRAQLRANADAHHAAQAEGRRKPDPAPVVKFFNPIGAATWLGSAGLRRDKRPCPKASKPMTRLVFFRAYRSVEGMLPEFCEHFQCCDMHTPSMGAERRRHG